MKFTCLIFILALGLCPATNAFAQSKEVMKVERKLNSGDTVKALKKLNRYIDRNEQQSDLYLLRAKIKLSRNDLEPAMVDLNSFCSLNKICGEAEYLKGVIRFKQGDYQGAIKHLSNYTSVVDDQKEAWFYLALSHMWLQNYPVAMHGFERVLALDATNTNALYNAGLSAYRLQQYEKANTFLLKAELVTPDDTDVRLLRGLSLLHNGDFIESNKVFRSIESPDKHYGSALYNIGVNYYNLNEKDLACEYWKRAISEGHLQAESARARHCGRK